jgi:hypothetical protein
MKHELYNSYLVRVWREDEGEGAEGGWRGEVESIQTGEKWQFTRLETMFRIFQEGNGNLPRRDGDTNGED